MLYSLKKKTGHERPQYKSTNKNKRKKQRDNTHPFSPHPNPDIKQPPPKENRYKPGGTNVQSLYWLFTWQRNWFNELTILFCPAFNGPKMERSCGCNKCCKCTDRQKKSSSNKIILLGFMVISTRLISKCQTDYVTEVWPHEP